MYQLLETWDFTYNDDSINGEQASNLDFNYSKWHKITVPGTVTGHLYEAGLIDDPYYNLNMRNSVGFKKGFDTHFALHPMPENSPFLKPIWYRTSFNIDKNENGNFFKLDFDGINFRANIWINGKLAVSSKDCVGSYKRYHFDISDYTIEKINTIAVELFAQKPEDLGITFIDWSPVPGDDSAGIWQPVKVYSEKSIAIEDIHITTELSDNFDSAKINISNNIVNNSNSTEEFDLELYLDDKLFSSKRLMLKPKQSFNYKEQLTEISPILWWPYQLGTPHLYKYTTVLKTVNNDVLNRKNVDFGIRKVESKINNSGAFEIEINNIPLLIRGTAWSPDLLLREDKNRDDIDIAYLKEMNLNTIRLEGKLASDYFWDLCNREGIIIMAGWPCCTRWEKWEDWHEENYKVAKDSISSQIKRLRNHPSFLIWLYGSDFPPTPKVEKIYLSILQSVSPQTIHLSSAAAFKSEISGETGVKMSGPYGYVPPNYWYDKNMPGVATGFNTETGPDSSFPRYESICKMLSKEQRFVGSDGWNHHSGLASFKDTEVMTSAIENRYGVSRSNLNRFIESAQLNAYEAWRAMYEAYGRNFPEGTGVIGWMMNGHWPSLIWQMYDWYMLPTGGFYGTKNACEQIHGQYSYDDNSIWFINSSLKSFTGKAIISIYDFNSNLIFSKDIDVSTEKNSRAKIVNKIDLNLDIQFLNIEIIDKSDESISNNFYWLSDRNDLLEERQSKEAWYYRPISKAVSFDRLNSLPKAKFEVSNISIDDKTLNFTINNSENIALATQMDIIINNDIVTPIFWSNNMLPLLPNRSTNISAKLPNNFLNNALLRIKPYNGDEFTTEI